jgi:hypothetical protein
LCFQYFENNEHNNNGTNQINENQNIGNTTFTPTKSNIQIITNVLQESSANKNNRNISNNEQNKSNQSIASLRSNVNISMINKIDMSQFITKDKQFDTSVSPL